jgi:hypothetical protein
MEIKNNWNFKLNLAMCMDYLHLIVKLLYYSLISLFIGKKIET